MTPEQMLALAENQLRAMERAKVAVVKVGLPEGEATSNAYQSDGDKSAPTVLDVGVWHEYGTQFVPMRSFLRSPFMEKEADLRKAINAQIKLVMEKGMDIEVALGRIGLTARNVSVGAFKTQGYGQWSDIKQSTKNAKGSSGVLIDTGLLRNSITWVVE